MNQSAGGLRAMRRLHLAPQGISLADYQRLDVGFTEFGGSGAGDTMRTSYT